MPLEELGPEPVPQTEVLLTKQDVIDRILSHLESGDVEPAISLYQRCRDDVGYELMNVVGGGADAENLTMLLLGARDYYKAAQVFEKVGVLDAAVNAFELAEAYDLAADLYGRLGKIAKSAEMLESGGSYGRAAPLFAQSERWLDAGRCYEKAGDVFEAGEAYVKAGEHNRALAALQKVEEGHEQYLDAVTLLGPILEELGLPELASRKYQEALGESSVESGNIAIFFALGKLYESTGRLEEAKEIYSRVLEKDVTYEDVQARYRGLKDRPSASEPSKPAETPAAYANIVVLSEDPGFLAESRLFQNLSFDETREILQFAEKRTFALNEPIHQEGQPFSGILLVQTGKVVISMIAEGKNVGLAQLGPGSHFGEMSLFGTKLAMISIFSAEPGSYVFIDAARLRGHLDAYPKLDAKIMKNIILSLDDDLLRAKEIVKTMYIRRRQ